MTPSLLYLSGPMSGRPDHNRPAFRAAARQLRAVGLTVWSPAELPAADTRTWDVAMRHCISALTRCAAVATLDGWEDSRGASLEVHIATQLGLPVHPLSTYLKPGPSQPCGTAGDAR